MSEIIEQARKNEALFKGLAQDSMRYRLMATQEVKQFDKGNRDREGKLGNADVGISVGVSYENGKWDFGLKGPTDDRQSLVENVLRHDTDVMMYNKLADLSGKGHIVSEPDFQKYKEHSHEQPSGLMGLFKEVVFGDSAPARERKSLDKYGKFVAAGGNVDELAKAVQHGGNEKDYLSHKKTGDGAEYIKGLVERELNAIRQSEKDAREYEKQERKRESNQEERESEKGKKKLSQNDAAIQDALEGINNSGAKLAEDKSALSVPESKPMVTTTQNPSQGNQIV